MPSLHASDGTRNTSSHALFQRRVHRAEYAVETGAETVHRGDDRKRDAGRDQTVFDCGGAILVVQESKENAFQRLAPVE